MAGSIAEQLRAAALDAVAAGSAYQLGKRAGVDQSILSRWLRGERDLTLETAGKIAAALQLELAPVRKTPEN